MKKIRLVLLLVMVLVNGCASIESVIESSGFPEYVSHRMYQDEVAMDDWMFKLFGFGE